MVNPIGPVGLCYGKSAVKKTVCMVHRLCSRGFGQCSGWGIAVSAVVQDPDHQHQWRKKIFVRVGGHGPAVVLLHGFGETGDMWQPLAAKLVADHTVIVPDLRGMGLSDHPRAATTKKNEARDIAGVLDALHIGQVDVVGHDIGNMVAYAFVAEQPERVPHLVLMDAPLPGVGPWDEILKSPLLWHFRFGGPDMERLVKGRERIYLDRFWNEFSADPKHFDEASRQHYAKLYARPGAMHSGFEQFHAFDQDVIDNHAYLQKKARCRCRYWPSAARHRLAPPCNGSPGGGQQRNRPGHPRLRPLVDGRTTRADHEGDRGFSALNWRYFNGALLLERRVMADATPAGSRGAFASYARSSAAQAMPGRA